MKPSLRALAFVLLAICGTACTSEAGKITVPIHEEWALTEVQGISDDIPESKAPVMRLVMTHISGKAVCNSYQGKFSLSGDHLSFSEIASTKMMCEPGIMDLENAFFEALQLSKDWKIDNNRLMLYDESGQKLASFRHVQSITENENY